MNQAKGANAGTTDWRLLLNLAWIDLTFVVLGVLGIGGGFYLWAHPELAVRADIQQLNQGVQAFNAPPGLLPAGDGRPAEYPIERAAWHWGQASALSTDKRIQSLAAYNQGTLVGREAWAQALSNSGRVNMAPGIQKLGEALRADPSNADAKFNLELMEKAAQQQGTKEGAPGPGYSPGGVQKGY
jgi:hypothetical protein